MQETCLHPWRFIKLGVAQVSCGDSLFAACYHSQGSFHSHVFTCKLRNFPLVHPPLGRSKSFVVGWLVFPWVLQCDGAQVGGGHFRVTMDTSFPAVCHLACQPLGTSAQAHLLMMSLIIEIQELQELQLCRATSLKLTFYFFHSIPQEWNLSLLWYVWQQGLI